ncbi:TetR/AcrR family transcriptional regulator [Xanthobacteraceae bacterium A53D]
MRRDDARLAVSRHAARLFLEKGLAGTSGDDIAAAAGLSTRTVWRYFRSKENCLEPLFLSSALRFGQQLLEWPAADAIEDTLSRSFALEAQTEQEIADGVLIVHLLARMADEPALHSVWLLACHAGEKAMAEAIAARLGRARDDFEVRLCAATVSAAIRVVDETISRAAVLHARVFTTEEVVAEVARAIRAASTLPICDPVTPGIFGATAPAGRAP